MTNAVSFSLRLKQQQQQQQQPKKKLETRDEDQQQQKEGAHTLLALLQSQACILPRLKTRKPAGDADVDAALQAHHAELKTMRGALQGEMGYSPAHHDEIWCVRFLLMHGKANVERAIAAAKFTLAHRRERRLDELRRVVTSRPRERWPGHAAIHKLLPLELLHPDGELGPCCLIRHGCGALEGRTSNQEGPLVQLACAAMPPLSGAQSTTTGWTSCPSRRSRRICSTCTPAQRPRSTLSAQPLTSAPSGVPTCPAPRRNEWCFAVCDEVTRRTRRFVGVARLDDFTGFSPAQINMRLVRSPPGRYPLPRAGSSLPPTPLCEETSGYPLPLPLTDAQLWQGDLCDAGGVPSPPGRPLLLPCAPRPHLAVGQRVRLCHRPPHPVPAALRLRVQPRRH